MLARGILGSGWTRGVSFRPFSNSSGWWWLISSLFLIRISCHRITHANGYYGAWPGWAVSISVLPLTVPLPKAKGQLESSRKELVWWGAAGGHWETTGRCGLAGLGRLKTKLKLVALTSILTEAGSSVSLLWAVFINLLDLGMNRVKLIFQIMALHTVFNKFSLLSFPHVRLHPVQTAGSFKSPSHTNLYFAGRGR